jgi:hypothetical protein
MSLCNNSIRETGLVALAEGVAKNDVIKSLHIWGNEFSSYAAQEWEMLLLRSNKIQTDIKTYQVDDSYSVARQL